MKLQKNRLLLLSVILLIGITVAAKESRVKVACIGNSITFGSVLSDPATESYPSQLQNLLGEGYEVGNFGRPGATVLRAGHNPYLKSPEFREALAFCPDIAVVHLGINDTDPRDWPEYGDNFITDYGALIDSLRCVNPSVRIIIAQLSPIHARHHRFRSGTRQWLRKIQEAIPTIARSKGTELISFDRPLRDRQDLLSDGIHPNAEGAKLLAEEVNRCLTRDYGVLKLPLPYQSGMVMQRDRYLPIRGTAAPGSRIALKIDGRSYTTKADETGNWTITVAPLTATGNPIEMTVSDGQTTIRLTDILVGELWIASGQSNMFFKLDNDINAESTIASAGDNQLRFFDMKPIEKPLFDPWADSIVAKTNRLDYYLPAKWEKAEGKNVGDWSAVAYYFARQLRDSLNVPVGVIHNSIGGAPIESWIDVTTLEDEMPEVLINWTENDYLQKWCQKRARENCGGYPSAWRHPFEPSYLFSAGVEPLGHLPVRGMIWYQGESNAHNTTLHEQLFPLMAQSWRRYFDDERMPIVFAQLSSIDRPSWPMFRDSQRRLASTMKDVYMAVTSDAGDSTDVHPRKKQPVGERLARQALHNVYGYNRLTAGGPEPVNATANGTTVKVTFKNGTGLHTSDGREAYGFEIAGEDGIFHAAKPVNLSSTLKDNEITLYSMNVTKPRAVRYGWQPFTRANLVNGDNLPATTFELKCENAETAHEKGIECGVSAPFAGMVGGKIVIAGGCNFPTDPMAADAQKKFYRGIYMADPETMEWERIYSLPQPTAYGASAVVDGDVILIGGTPEGKPTAEVKRLVIKDGGDVEINDLPSLPMTLDNHAAVGVGQTVYVCGGNLDGVPSRSLYALDLNQPEKEWKKLADMPGNPRVQPVMAAGKDCRGNVNLYVWGGFAGKHNGKQATLELDGLRYEISCNKWSRIDGPKDNDGIALATGGGAAVTLTDGRIAVVGGVNKDVFLEALRNQAPDYLQHPIEWYRFNPNVVVFDPETENWSVATSTPDAARAGAVVVESAPNEITIMGGELKPRIRTSESLKIKL